MMIPHILLGTGPIVRRRVKRVISAARSGPDSADFGDLVEVEANAGACLLIDQVDRHSHGEHFHVYAVFNEILAGNDRDAEHRWFEWSLKSAWSLCGLLGSGADLFLMTRCKDDQQRKRYEREYLHAMARHIDEMIEVGPRFAFLGKQRPVGELSSLACALLRKAGVEVSTEDNVQLKSSLTRFVEEK